MESILTSSLTTSLEPSSASSSSSSSASSSSSSDFFIRPGFKKLTKKNVYDIIRLKIPIQALAVMLLDSNKGVLVEEGRVVVINNKDERIDIESYLTTALPGINKKLGNIRTYLSEAFDNFGVDLDDINDYFTKNGNKTALGTAIKNYIKNDINNINEYYSDNKYKDFINSAKGKKYEELDDDEKNTFTNILKDLDSYDEFKNYIDSNGYDIKDPENLINFLNKNTISSISLPTATSVPTSVPTSNIFDTRDDFRQEFSNLFHESISYYINSSYKYPTNFDENGIGVLTLNKNLSHVNNDYHPVHLLSCITFLDGKINDPLFNKLMSKNLSIFNDKKYKNLLLYKIDKIIQDFGKKLLIDKPVYDGLSTFDNIYKEFHEIIQIYRSYLNPNNFITNYDEETDQINNETKETYLDINSYDDVYNFKKIDPKEINVDKVSKLETSLIRYDNDPLIMVPFSSDETDNLQSKDDFKEFYNNSMTNTSVLIDIR